MGFIYWVASYPKSGNTWMRAFLTSLVGGGLKNGLQELGEVIPPAGSGVFYQPVLKKPIAQATNTELALARPRVHRRLAKETQNFLLLKTHAMVAVHRGTHTVTPDVTAGAIYIVRNPLDVVISASEYRNRGIDRTIELLNTSGRELERPVHGISEPSGSWKENVESWTKPHPRVAVVRYEDLLEDPTKVFSGVVKHLKMQASPEQIEKAIADSSFESLKAQEQSTGFQERPGTARAFFRSGRAGEWRERLSSEQVAAIAIPNEAPMRRFGYWLEEFDDLAGRRTASADLVGQTGGT